MPMRTTKGNMYPWVTHVHTHLGGECAHKCCYCYIENPRWGRPARYKGPIRLLEDEFRVKYGAGKTIFIEHMNDLFAEGVPRAFIEKIIDHCKKWPDNTYVFQTKNPARYNEFSGTFPGRSIFGTTIETNISMPDISEAPDVSERYVGIRDFLAERKFVTIEPVLDFDVEILAAWIADIEPEFLNLGADSKQRDLPEPTVEKVMALVDALAEYGIELREKHNLGRLKAK